MSDYGFGMEHMMEAFLFETTGLLEDLDGILLEVEKKNVIDEEHINEIFRIMHTVKGSSSMMSYDNVAKVAHIIEDLFYFIRENGMKDKFFKEAFDLVFKGHDFISEEIEKIQEGQNPDGDSDDLSEKIKALLNKMTNDDATDAQEDDEAKEQTSQTTDAQNTEQTACEENSNTNKVRVFLEDGCEMENMRAYLLVNNIAEYCDNLTYEPSDIVTNPDAAKYIIEHGFMITFENLVELEQIGHIIERTPHVKTYEFLTQKEEKATASQPEQENKAEAKPEEKPAEAQAVVPERTKEEATKTPEKQSPAAASQIKTPKQNLINVSLSKLDTLMNIVGEIVITESMVTSSPDLKGLALDNFSKASRQLRKLTDELQDIVMSIRMVPISGAFQKMFRIVRDMSKKLGKDVELQLVGEETEVDKTIIDSIGDPLMHLVRNAMDHGIEDVETRAANGKPEKGTILLSAVNNGGEILITVSDDGKGLDPEYIINKAKANNLLVKPESEYTEKEIMSLVLLPGFSTKEQVTEFSGRGVGMDVVKKNIEKVGGTVVIESKKGRGTNIIFKIPLTLAIVDGMEFSVGDSIYTIPITTIKQCFKIEDESIISDTSEHEMVMIRGICYPIIRLHDFYRVKTDITELKDGILILVETEEKSVCLFADRLVGEQQVVVKPFPTFLNRFKVKEHGIAGCTILGDGSISLILDAVGIIESYM